MIGLLIKAGALAMVAAGSALFHLGYHRHRCPKCRRTWWHAEAAAFNCESAHRCPGCNELQWVQS